MKSQEHCLKIDETSTKSKAVALLAHRSQEIDGRELQNLLELAQGMDSLLSNPQQAAKFEKFYFGLTSLNEMQQAQQQIDDWEKAGIGVLPFWDEKYPISLRNIFKPPVIIFYRGRLPSDLNRHPFLAVVGSRRADMAGCQIAKTISEELAAKGVCIVSGLAYGIDAAAHSGALKASGAFPTIAVMGNGLLSVYPSKHEDLAREIIEKGGLLISQFEPDERPYPSNFLNRNRIIAGICPGTLIVQATERSGSLATARYAMEEGREVLVIPGDIADPRYEGSNNLIKQGAYLITDTADIYAALPALLVADKEVPQENKTLSAEVTKSNVASQIVAYLKQNGQSHCDHLAQHIGAAGEFYSELIALEMSGKVARLPGNQIALVQRASRGQGA